jgi:hypothetical protein
VPGEGARDAGPSEGWSARAFLEHFHCRRGRSVVALTCERIRRVARSQPAGGVE